MKNTSSIGILGGTFDPIHNGHLRLAINICEDFALEHIRLIPSNTPPHRPQTIASPDNRLKMIKLAIKNSKQLIADDREINRDGPSYTIDTLESLQADFPNHSINFILGVDAANLLTSWQRWEAILSIANLIIVTRPGYQLDPKIHEQLTRCSGYTESVNANSSRPINQVNQPHGTVFQYNLTPLAISATQIREIIRSGKNPRYLLPDDVLNFIKSNNIYS